MTTIEIERADTGEMAAVYQIPAAATDGRWLPTVPEPAERRGHLPRRPHHDVPAYDYARLIGSATIPADRAAIRDVRLHMRVGWEHLRQQAQDWEDLAFWAHERQQDTGPQHRDLTTPLMAAYERERDALIRGLPTAASLPEQHPARELAPDRLDADHARRVKVAQQRQHRDTLAPLAAERQVQTESGDHLQPDGTVPESWWRRALAWLGGAGPDRSVS